METFHVIRNYLPALRKPCNRRCLAWDNAESAYWHQLEQRRRAWKFHREQEITILFRYRCDRCGHFSNKIHSLRAIVTATACKWGVLIRIPLLKCKRFPWPPRSDTIVGVAAFPVIDHAERTKRILQSYRSLESVSGPPPDDEVIGYHRRGKHHQHR